MRAPRLWGLDSLRALAVIFVIVYHFFPSFFPGGYIGVDVFFVLSGFLITSLLLQEWLAQGRISLRQFWMRRARRILPALTLVVAVMTACAGFIGGDITAGLRAQLFGALTFSSNWVSIFTGSGYEAQLTPALFTNLWSLAVEEQFYVLWPLVVIIFLSFTRAFSHRRARAVGAAVSVIIAIFSLWLMAVKYVPDTDPSRVYLGTDTHMFGLMVGAILAFIMMPSADFRWPHRFPFLSRFVSEQRGKMVHLILSVIALSALVWAGLAMHFHSAVPYRGGLVAVSVATAALVAAMICNQDVARRMEKRVVRWVGQRSYGLYLWHWPVLVVVTYVMQSRNAGSNVSFGVFLVAVASTVALSAMSYRYVEQPIMRYGFRTFFVGKYRGVVRYWQQCQDAIKTRDKKALRRPAGSLVLLFSLLLTVFIGDVRAFAIATETTTIAASIEQGAALLEQENHTTVPFEDDDSTESSAPQESPTLQPEPTPTQTAKPQLPSSKKITIIGDSVTLSAVPQLRDKLPKAAIDAEVSRPLSDAPKIMKKLDKKGKLRPFVVISLATNSTAKQYEIDAILKAAGDRKVVFVTGYGDRSWIKPTNKLLKNTAQKHDNVVLADWAKTAKQHPEEFSRDGIHPTPDGAKRYTRLITDTLAQINTQ
ncbi:acyltransferase family protein [Timonella sp. A28]|uniref:acyltransferase family protein n=1 Tax=Timonella sp. A28 TaxID=3442640 RepID=UPI003EB7F654